MSNASHLQFYIQNDISPVHYVNGNLQEHLERRASLYRSLGLLPLAVRGSRVLEVAVGSGQNSLYLASLKPQTLTLVEPNPTGIREIRALYAQTRVSVTAPTLVESTLQDYQPADKFDVVICENWLGRVPHERALLRKLAGMIDLDGMLVVTTQPPVGLLPNFLRRALSAKYSNPRLGFSERTETLVAMFAPHLATMKAMTRSATDWVQDNMINPAYFDLYLTIPDVLTEVGETMTVVGTNPSFDIDLRWFKSLHGDARDFNNHMIRQYQATQHNLLDYEIDFYQPSLELNHQLETASVAFLESVRSYEHALIVGESGDEALLASQAALHGVLACMKDFPLQTRAGVEDGLRLLESNGDYKEVATDSHFSRLFGRENIYLSMIADKVA
uniref:class I SAM-dependent methyltransferase n=1 Tax=Limnohabitans sp. TaxID=1907725 RepID=UPI004047911B